MEKRLDAAKDYLLSVAERSVGLARAKEYYNDNKPDPNNPYSMQFRIEALFGAGTMWLCQAALPLIERSWMDEFNGIRLDKPPSKAYEYSVSKVALATAGYVLDTATGITTLILWSRNPAEAVAFKLIANTASHIVGDIAVKGVDRIKHFNPSSSHSSFLSL